MTNKKFMIIWIILLIGIITYAAWVQTLIIINHDNFTLLQVAQKLLNGGHYYYDFFDVNPPMILYLYMPPVFISNVFHLDVYTVFRVYVFVMALFILAICNSLFKSSQVTEKPYMRYAMITSLLIVFVVMFPVFLGQREHLTLMLIMPYLILASMRCQKIPVKIYLSVLIGVLAGVGFVFKPQFLIPFLLVELYLTIKNRKLFASIRPETIAIVLLGIVYFISLFVLTPEYLGKIVPLIWMSYYAAHPFSFTNLLSHMPGLFFLLSFICFYVVYKRLHFKILCKVLVVATFGFIIVCLLQHTVWQYHFLTAYGLVIFLDFILIFEVLSALFQTSGFKERQNSWDPLLITIILGLIIFSPLYSMYKNVHMKLLTAQIQKVKPIKALIEKYGGPNKSVYLFTPNMTDRLMLIRYSNANISSRFEVPLYLIKGMHNAIQSARNAKVRQILVSKKKKLVNLMVDDFQEASPDLVFYFYNIYVNLRKKNIEIHLLSINYFLNNKRFLKLAKQYQFLDIIGHFVVFKKVQHSESNKLEMSNEFFSDKLIVKGRV